MSDGVSIGLFAGSFASIFVVLGGLAAATSRNKLPNGDLGDYSYKYFTYGYGLFFWLILLTAMLTGVLIYVKILSDYFEKLPKQLDTTATVT